MAHWYHLTKQTSNKKLAKPGHAMAASTTSRDSCPTTCELKGNGCYAESGPLKLHWDKVSLGPGRGISLFEFCEALRALPMGSCFRHNQAGDLPHLSGFINFKALELITAACAVRKLKAWTYTHHKVDNSHNLEVIEKAIKSGLTVNISAQSQSHAAAMHKQGLPSVCIVPRGEDRKHWEYDGVKFLVCPAQTSEKTCSECKLCAIADRSCVVSFKAHGTQARKAEALIA